jgi:hypothetical protein
MIKKQKTVLDKKNIVGITIGLIIGILLIYFFVVMPTQSELFKTTQNLDEMNLQLQSTNNMLGLSQQELVDLNILFEQTKEENVEFLKDYSVAVVNIHFADYLIDLAIKNSNTANDLFYDSDVYDYFYLKTFTDLSINQLNEAKVLLRTSKENLNKIKNNSPNSFFENEINKRLLQVNEYDKTIVLAIDLVNAKDKEYYAYIYEEYSDYEEKLSARNLLVSKYNEQIDKYNQANKEIELIWKQGWYVLDE